MINNGCFFSPSDILWTEAMHIWGGDISTFAILGFTPVVFVNKRRQYQDGSADLLSSSLPSTG